MSFIAVLNSTLVGLFKTFYGRYTGTEGSLDTEVIDVRLVEVPNPKGIFPQLGKRLTDAFERMGKRDVGRLIEEQLMDCHTPERARKLAAGPLVYSQELRQADRRELDEAVFELLGVVDPTERAELLRRLYDATARHFRDIRVVEIDKMVQRAKSETRRFSVPDLAADIWDAAEWEDATPMAEWLEQQPESDSLANIPGERPAVLLDNPLFGDNTVYFGKRRQSNVACQSRGQAELVACLATLGVSGDVKVPTGHSACLKLLGQVNDRLERARARLLELTQSRTGDEFVRQQLMELLERWFVLGRDKDRGV